MLVQQTLYKLICILRPKLSWVNRILIALTSFLIDYVLFVLPLINIVTQMIPTFNQLY